MHDEQQRQPDARTQQVLSRVRHIINKKEHPVYSRPPARQPCGAVIVPAGLHGGYRPSARAGGSYRRRFLGIPLWLVAKGAAQRLRRQGRRIPEKSPGVREPEDRARPLRGSGGAAMKDKPFYYQDNRALHERKMNEAARLEISRRNIEFILEHQRDSAAELAAYLRRCQAEELGHVPAQSEVLGGDLLALRFGSWGNALAYSGFPVSTGQAVSNFPLERTALFRAEYERQSALHAQAKKDRKKRPKPLGANRSPRKSARQRPPKCKHRFSFKEYEIYLEKGNHRMKKRQIPLQGKGRRFRADLWLDEKNHRADAACAADARHQVPRWLESPENAGVQAGIPTPADAVPSAAGGKESCEKRETQQAAQKPAESPAAAPETASPQ